MEAFYHQNVTRAGYHLELGCGMEFSGFEFAKKTQFTLLDTDHNALNAMENLLLDHKFDKDIETVLTNVKSKSLYRGNRIFNSVGSRHLLQWVPGAFPKKISRIVENLHPNMDEDTVFFGITALGDLSLYNPIGRFAVKPGQDMDAVEKLYNKDDIESG